eukprot:95358-Rhodomonas_salina.1
MRMCSKGRVGYDTASQRGCTASSPSSTSPPPRTSLRRSALSTPRPARATMMIAVVGSKAAAELRLICPTLTERGCFGLLNACAQGRAALDRVAAGSRHDSAVLFAASETLGRGQPHPWPGLHIGGHGSVEG